MHIQTHRQQVDLISLLLFLNKESRLKIHNSGGNHRLEVHENRALKRIFGHKKLGSDRRMEKTI
jgi:hypothetical protein